MKKPKPGQVFDITDARQEWADYCRVRKNPSKECTVCRKTFPNSRESFHTNTSGRITSTCNKCWDTTQQERASVARAGPERADCPVCDTFDTLLTDHIAPRPTRLCRGCMILVNAFRRPSRASVPDRLNRFYDYVLWQQRLPNNKPRT